MMTTTMKILYAAAEVVPFAKTGGLADVAGALPKVLAGLGHDVRIVMPLYGSIDRVKYGLHPATDIFHIPLGKESVAVSIEESEYIPGVKIYFVDNASLYDRPALYGYPDDDHRFVTYCRALLEMLPRLGWKPDIINCNDWHTGLVPVYLKTLYADSPELCDIGTLYTIHNLAYQGLFPPEVMDLAGLPWELFTWNQLEYWGKFNFMKAGLVFADALSTVSPTYAKEIQTEAYGEGLQGVLAHRSTDLFGILNGIDLEIWNPSSDPWLPEHFSPDDTTGKRACKLALQAEVGLTVDADVPLFGIVSRLSAQKGFDILAEILPNLLKKETMQLVILGTGDALFHDLLTKLTKKCPEKLAIALKFDNGLAHRIYAGCDAFLMPSRYEPCGLGQMISLAYGTIPVVRATGGLADTVKEFKRKSDRNYNDGNGFVFEPYTAQALKWAITRALSKYSEPEGAWTQIIMQAFHRDFSWEASARQYLRVYHQVLTRLHAASSPE